MKNFAAVGARFGLRPSAPTPVYGLAEATLAVSFGAHDGLPIFDSVSRDAVVADHHARPMRQHAEIAQQIVCVGFPVKGMDVRIVREGSVQGPREIGAIELRGPAVAGSYLTMDGVFPLARHDGWFDSGDLGYLDEEGRLYVCGRTKDLIMRGRDEPVSARYRACGRERRRCAQGLRDRAACRRRARGLRGARRSAQRATRRTCACVSAATSQPG